MSTVPENEDVEVAARKYCDWILTSRMGRSVAPDTAETLVVLAFTVGALWALELPDMMLLMRAQYATEIGTKQ